MDGRQMQCAIDLVERLAKAVGTDMRGWFKNDFDLAPIFRHPPDPALHDLAL